MALIADFDNYDGQLDFDDLIACRRAGIRQAIVGLQYPGNGSGVAHIQIEKLLYAGISLRACYAESQFIGDVWQHVSQFRADIPQIFKACEEDVITVDRADIDRNLDFIDALSLNRRGGIYTREGWWRGQEFDHWFGDRDLWAAQYDNRPDIETVTPFGDWQRAELKQWVQGVQIGSLRLSLNVDRAW